MFSINRNQVLAYAVNHYIHVTFSQIVIIYLLLFTYLLLYMAVIIYLIITIIYHMDNCYFILVTIYLIVNTG